MDKLGIGYNCFGDSIELLEASAKSVREVAEYIVVVYQDISNWGNKSKVDQLPILEDLKTKKIIDEYVFYQPKFSKIFKKKNAHRNEIKKRNIALQNCIKKGCSYFISMDNDEFYKKDELLMAKKFMFENKDYQSSACQMQNYFKEPIYRMTSECNYYVSLINRVSKGSRFVLRTPYPAKGFFDRKFFSKIIRSKNSQIKLKLEVDPTRRIANCKNVKAFKRGEIEMHHMSYVRRDISEKIHNSSGKALLLKFENQLKSNDHSFMKTVMITENIFNIKI